MIMQIPPQLIEQLDLRFLVETSVAHPAGAMGSQCGFYYRLLLIIDGCWVVITPLGIQQWAIWATKPRELVYIFHGMEDYSHRSSSQEDNGYLLESQMPSLGIALRPSGPSRCHNHLLLGQSANRRPSTMTWLVYNVLTQSRTDYLVRVKFIN